jgi:hypothetical protein
LAKRNPSGVICAFRGSHSIMTSNATSNHLTRYASLRKLERLTVQHVFVKAVAVEVSGSEAA